MTEALTRPARLGERLGTVTRPMRLLAINNYHYRRGGAEVVFLEHNRLMEEIGWDVLTLGLRRILRR